MEVESDDTVPSAPACSSFRDRHRPVRDSTSPWCPTRTGRTDIPLPSRVPLPTPLRPGTTVIELEFFFRVAVAWWYDPSTDTVRADFIGYHNMAADGKAVRQSSDGALELIIPKAGDHHFLTSLAQSYATLAPAIRQQGFVMRFVVYGPPVSQLKPSEFTHQLTLTDPNITGFFCNNLT